MTDIKKRNFLFVWKYIFSVHVKRLFRDPFSVFFFCWIGSTWVQVPFEFEDNIPPLMVESKQTFEVGVSFRSAENCCFTFEWK